MSLQTAAKLIKSTILARPSRAGARARVELSTLATFVPTPRRHYEHSRTFARRLSAGQAITNVAGVLAKPGGSE